MTLYEKITDLLNSNNTKYKIIHHKPVRTSKEAAEVRGCKEEEGAKSLIFLVNGKPIDVVLEGNKRVDKEKLIQHFSAQNLKPPVKIKMAGANHVFDIAGVEVGGVPPFGNLFKTPISIYLNKSFLNNKYMEFNAGDRSISIRMKTQDWIGIIPHTLLDLSE